MLLTPSIEKHTGHFKVAIVMSTPTRVDKVKVKPYGSRKHHPHVSTAMRAYYVKFIQALIKADKLSVGIHHYTMRIRTDSEGGCVADMCPIKETTRFIPSPFIPSFTYKNK